MNHPPPLQIHQVHFAYGAVPILRGITLEVQQGEMVGLVGPNGAGKTTLLDIISGVLRPQSGEVSVGGTSLVALRPRERAKRVAVVPQNPTVPHGFTALDVVLMGRNPHLALLQWEGAEDLAVCRRAMERTGTWEFAHRPLSSLSGGERQRVFIARALAQEAHLLLLDEPTAHLDIGYQSGILDIVQVIRRAARVTVVAAMHDLSLAAQYCDRMAVLRQGALIALGRPEEVLTPEVVSSVFGAPVSITRHPVHQTPVVLPVGKSVIPTKMRARWVPSSPADGGGLRWGSDPNRTLPPPAGVGEE